MNPLFTSAFKKFSSFITTLFLIVVSINAFSQCELVVDANFNNRSGNEVYTVTKANQDFGTIRAWTASTIRGLDGTNQDFPHTTRAINGELRAEYMKNDAGGYAGGFLFDREFDPVEEAVLEYKVKFDKDFVWASGGKLPGLGGTALNNAGAIPSGCTMNQNNIDNGFSCRLMWRRNRAQTDTPYLILYLYHPYKDRCGDNIRILTGLQKEKWYTIRQYVKMNTPGQNNGIIRMWIDGDQVLNKTDVLLRKSGKSNVKINALVANTYRGGSRTDPIWHSPTTDYAYFDDFKVWTNCSDPDDTQVDINEPPTVSFDPATLTYLEEGYDNFYVQALASDPENNIAKVVLSIDGTETRPESQFPYEWGHATTPNPSETLNLSPGTHTLKLVVTDDKGATAEATMQIVVTEKGVTYLSPIHDAYLQGGNGDRFNDGDLRIENGNRITYLKFDVSEIDPLALENAQLELTVSSDDGAGQLTVFEGSTTSWLETNLSTSNAPNKGTIGDELDETYAIGNTYTLDIPTDFFSSPTLNLVLEMGSGSNDVSFASKENSTYIGPRLKIKQTDVVLGSLSIEENSFVVYPNPSTTRIFNFNDIVKWEVRDLRGVLIRQGESETLDLSNETPGNYLLFAKNQTFKLVTY